MPTTFEEVREQVLKLQRDEQALLAEELISKLDSDSTDAFENEWLQEAASRYEAYKQGRIEAIPAAEVHRRILDNRQG